MFRLPVLALALVISGPALWSAFVDGDTTIQTVLVRFLIAVPVAAIMVTAFTSMTSHYARQVRRSRVSEQIEQES